MDGAPVNKTILLQNVLRPGLSLEELEQRGDRAVYTRSFIQTVDGEVILSSVQSDTFRDVVEAVDKAYGGYTEEQKLLLQTFCQTYASLLKKWELPNMIPAEAASFSR